jgi:hypothetical protein
MKTRGDMQLTLADLEGDDAVFNPMPEPSSVTKLGFALLCVKIPYKLSSSCYS